MFWKKKKKVDLEFPGDDRDHRAAFRVKPDQTRPVILTLAGNSYHAMNISGTGCCFRSHNYPVGTVGAGTIRIPSDDIIFPVTIQIVAKERDLCRCQFTKISELAEDALHAYVLEIQKKQIRGQ